MVDDQFTGAPMKRIRRMLVVLAACSAAPAALSAQTPGQTIRAKDGDVILVENNDKVRIVRRHQANVRVVYNAAQKWILIVADYLAGPNGGDGRVDMSHTFREISGDWPLGERWEGTVFLDQTYLAGEVGPRNMTLTTSGGAVQFVGFPERLSAGPADSSVIATITYRGAGSGMARGTFDQAEQQATAELSRPDGVAGGFRSSISMTAELSPSAAYSGPQPVRVGGNIRAPQKIKDAPGVMPEAARQAGVFGMVILEIIIGTDGTVQQAKVLRSISLLDEAAIAAVKQWAYEPTLLDGMPVPVIMTVTVNFR